MNDEQPAIPQPVHCANCGYIVCECGSEAYGEDPNYYKAKNALENCRLFAAKNRHSEWAPTILRFCAEGGCPGSPLRATPQQPAAASAGASDELTTCNCRWDGEKLVQQCTLHEAWRDAITDWAERAKAAERKLETRAALQSPPVATEMSRCLLHRSKLGAFKVWLAEQGIEHRPGRGDYQVLQVMTERSSWQVVYDRGEDRQHFTVTGPLEHTVRKFINAAAKRPQSGSDTPPLATEWTKLSMNESAAHPAAGEATERAGWKLVPIEPTEAMVDAGHEAIKEEHDRGVGNWGECGGHSWREPREAWKAMLAAVSGEATERGSAA